MERIRLKSERIVLNRKNNMVRMGYKFEVDETWDTPYENSLPVYLSD